MNINQMVEALNSPPLKKAEPKMMRKTSELTGAALDWAVAKCEGLKLGGLPYNPSSNWKYGGPVIEREKIELRNDDATGEIWAQPWDQDEYQQSGPTPLIAAMRCYVASKLGDEVDVPDELND